jgi:hypothetical protein
MRKQYVLIAFTFTLGCGQPSSSALNGETPPKIAYSIINAKDENGNQFYDVFVKDTSQIGTLNLYLKNKYNPTRMEFLQINYFSDSMIARTYFAKQFDKSVSEKEKDKIFRFYVANYKYNPASKYDTLVFEH